MIMNEPQDSIARRRRSIRLALMFAVLAFAFYGGFILMTGLH